jgi:hypothetical protein
MSSLTTAHPEDASSLLHLDLTKDTSRLYPADRSMKPSTIRELALELDALRREGEIHRRCEGETTKRLESDIAHTGSELMQCLKKDEYTARHQPLEDRISVLVSRVDKIEARGQGRGDSFNWINMVVGTIAGVIATYVLLKGLH